MYVGRERDAKHTHAGRVTKLKRVRVDDPVGEALDDVTEAAGSTKSAVSSEAMIKGLRLYADERGLDWEEIVESNGDGDGG